MNNEKAEAFLKTVANRPEMIQCHLMEKINKGKSQFVWVICVCVESEDDKDDEITIIPLAPIFDDDECVPTKWKFVEDPDTLLIEKKRPWWRFWG